MEHLHHFELGDDPFRNDPLPGLYHASDAHRDALRRLERGVRQAKGLSLLLGEVGSGKTMVVRRLLEGLESEVFELVMMVALSQGPGAANANWVLRRFAAQLGVDAPEAEREALLAQIYDQLAIVREDGRHAVLVIDDAQALASPATLAEVGALLKLEYEDRRLVSVVLVGDSSLEPALARDPALCHRVDVKVRLAPLDREAAADYLGHRIRRAGGDPSILDEGAVQALHRCGRGLPGRMNTLADNALFEAYLSGRRRVSGEDVERARRDLAWRDEGGRDAAPAAAGDGTSLADLDADLEAVFEPADEAPRRRTRSPLRRPRPRAGPPKDDDGDVDDLLGELIDD